MPRPSAGDSGNLTAPIEPGTDRARQCNHEQRHDCLLDHIGTQEEPIQDAFARVHVMSLALQGAQEFASCQ